MPTPHVPTGSSLQTSNGPVQASNNLRWKTKPTNAAPTNAAPTQAASATVAASATAPTAKPEVTLTSGVASPASNLPSAEPPVVGPVLRQPGDIDNASASSTKLEAIAPADVKLEPLSKSDKNNTLRSVKPSIAKPEPAPLMDPVTKNGSVNVASPTCEPPVGIEPAPLTDWTAKNMPVPKSEPAPKAEVVSKYDPTLARPSELRSVLKPSAPAPTPIAVERDAVRGTIIAQTGATETLPPKNPRMARSVRMQTPPDETLPSNLQPSLVIPDDAIGGKLPAPPAAERSLRSSDPFSPTPMDTLPMDTLPMPGDRREQTEKCPPGQPCQDTFVDCKAQYEAVKKHTIDTINLDIALKGVQGEDFPCNCPVPTDIFQPRNWSCTTYTWKASGVCHKPLYFEEPGLERYGHNCGHCVQPFVSAACFFGSIAVLPYKMGLETPCECVYPLGFYRPGECAPRMCPAVPLSLRAGLCEAGAVTGACFIVP